MCEIIGKKSDAASLTLSAFEEKVMLDTSFIHISITFNIIASKSYFSLTCATELYFFYLKRPPEHAKDT